MGFQLQDTKHIVPSDTTTDLIAIKTLLTGELVSDMTKQGYADHIQSPAQLYSSEECMGWPSGLLKLGFILDFIPTSVINGYMSAAAAVAALTIV